VLSKVWSSPAEAVGDIFNGATVLFGGFAGVGVPIHLFRALARLPVNNLVGVSNHCGDGEDGLALLLKQKQIGKMITSFPDHVQSHQFRKLYAEGAIEVEMSPQGTLAERIRAGGAGVAGFYTRTGVGTAVAEGKEMRVFDGQSFLFERAIKADFALIKGSKADTLGNVVFHRSARTFNPDMAMGARCAIVEVDEIVEPGSIDPDDVHLPSIFVHRVVKAPGVVPNPTIVDLEELVSGAGGSGLGWSRAEMAKRVAAELNDGDYVNLGVGMPTLVPAFLRPGVTVFFHSENGLLGMGPFATPESVDPECINASRQAVTMLPGSSTFRHSESFAMIRGGHISVAVLGGYQVSEKGDLANWKLPNQSLGGIGGAMDLAANVGRIIVVMEHTTKTGEPRILKRCSYALTAPACVSLVVTNLAVIAVTPEGLVVREVAPGVTMDQVVQATEAHLIIP